MRSPRVLASALATFRSARSQLQGPRVAVNPVDGAIACSGPRGQVLVFDPSPCAGFPALHRPAGRDSW